MRVLSNLSRYLLVLLLCAWWSTPHAEVLTLETAQADITVDADTQTADVQLPYGWDSHHKGQAGTGRFVLTFAAPQAVDAAWGLYFHRLGNGYQVKLNGMVLDANGALYAVNESADRSKGYSDYAKIPRFVSVPPGLLLPVNQLEVTIRSESGRRSGMPRVLAGPKDELEPIYQRAFAIRVGGSGAFTVFSLVVGIFALVLWVSQTDPRPESRGRRDPLYLYAALAEFAWALFIGDTLIERPPLTWAWWSVVINMALAVWLSALLMFCHTIAGWTHMRASRWVQVVLVALLLTGPAVAYSTVALYKPLLLTLWQAVFALVFLPSTLLFMAQALRKTSDGMHRLVALAFVVNVPVGVHDFYAMRLGEAFGNIAYLRYTATLFGLALGAIAIERFRSANIRVGDMLNTLAERVHHKERELSHTYQRMEAIAREQERVQERARILRDMHDGVGSHITSAIRQLRSGRANPDEILLTLQDSLDQLKLSIDALNLPPGDVTALLANLRYRLEPRFRAMGLALEWAVVSLPALPTMDAGAMRQLQYILFEAFSNAMQHAQANILRIEATLEGHSERGVCIRVCDNGVGFDPEQVVRKGLASMEERATAIGAQLRVYSQPGNTVVALLIG